MFGLDLSYCLESDRRRVSVPGLESFNVMQKLLKMFGIWAVASILSTLIAHPAKAGTYCSYQMAGESVPTVDYGCSFRGADETLFLRWGDGVNTEISFDWDSANFQENGSGVIKTGYANVNSSGRATRSSPRYHFEIDVKSSGSTYHLWRNADSGTGTHHIYIYDVR
jgi:hypothetical protein